jgi:tetratricopeptide (TPR) repeat protein
MKKISFVSAYLALYLVLVGCSTEMDDLRISDEQVNHMEVLYGQAIDQLGTDPTKAIQTAKQILESAEEVNYRTGIGDAQHVLGLAYDFRGRYDSAAYHHLIALEQRRELNDETKLGKSYDNLGIVYLQLGVSRAGTFLNLAKRLPISMTDIGIYRSFQGKT